MAKKTKKTEEITKKFGDERRKALDDALKTLKKILVRVQLCVLVSVQSKSSGYELRLASFGYCSWCGWLP